MRVGFASTSERPACIQRYEQLRPARLALSLTNSSVDPDLSTSRLHAPNFFGDACLPDFSRRRYGSVSFALFGGYP
jgi:hypothetical protein